MIPTNQTMNSEINSYIDDHLNGDRKLIISLSWRDIKSPKSGGAEVHTHELLKAIDKARFCVVHVAFMYDGLTESEVIDDILYVRHGQYLGYILFARNIYRRYADKVQAVFDQCNTWRAFTRFWVRSEHRVFYIHQLTREIWHIQSSGVFAWIGEHTETAMLKLNRHDHAITVSESTRQDLVDVGFDPQKILIVRNGLPKEIYDFDPETAGILMGKKEVDIPKESGEKGPVFIYVGRYARYKGIDDALRAFGQFVSHDPEAKLWLVGKPDEQYWNENLLPVCDEYGLKVFRADKAGNVSGDATAAKADDEMSSANVIIWGFVSEQEKYALMSCAHVLICPSIREGWGIIISEAGYLGTPSIVYDSPGIRDAVDHGKAGYLCRSNIPVEIERLMKNSVYDQSEYQSVKAAAYEFASELRWENNAKPINDWIEQLR